tara:strand:- start:1056 stop:1280 length:225 start_codon:yes stop_codon:yes gene_type:complete
MNIVEELKLKKANELIEKNKTIKFDNYFKYSGKQEIGNKFIFFKFDYEIILKDKIKIKNDMSKYKLKNYENTSE